ncbi:Uncharacterized protein dnm_042670 [Desulfonema magnum]|uniref:Uncharacterized protein n=1 Tax=Desulfonema magnum TaxID=45655 RepID=A0A975BNM3_9BACT|nr:Uncharacterized protein dnm_042670 [Desulfonema magnum]
MRELPRLLLDGLLLLFLPMRGYENIRRHHQAFHGQLVISPHEGL